MPAPRFSIGQCVVLAKTGGAPDMYVVECASDEAAFMEYTLAYFDNAHAEFKYVVLPELALLAKPEKQQ